MKTITIEVNENSHRYFTLMNLLRRENFIYEIQSKPNSGNTVLAVSTTQETVRAAAVKHAEHIWGKDTEWISEYNSSVTDFTAGAEWTMSRGACATAKGEERKD